MCHYLTQTFADKNCGGTCMHVDTQITFFRKEKDENYGLEHKILGTKKC